MNKTFISLVFLPLAVSAQSPVSPNPSIYISAQDIAKKMARADAMEKAGVPDTGPYSLLKQLPFHLTMEYRLTAAGHASIHELNSELFVVLEGSGTMSVGGKLINPTRNGDDLRAAKSEGGISYKLNKGDILLVPPNTAHYVNQVDGKLAMLSVHIPLASADHWPTNGR